MHTPDWLFDFVLAPATTRAGRALQACTAPWGMPGHRRLEAP